jgi:hypothetical protein
MMPFGRVRNSLALGLGVVLATLLWLAPLVAADPGDEAANQKRYPAMQTGAKDLLKAHDILEKGNDNFKGHRVAAMKLIKDALRELDDGVKYADKHNEKGEKTKSIFDADRGKLAASQSKYPAIQGGAKKVIEAGKALDQGLDRFGGHRVKALKDLNEALDELEKAVKQAK